MYNDKAVLAIIPARGGSKKLPRKNINLLGGKPLIYYTIEAGLRSRYIDRLILSTDDEEIAKIAKDLGAEVPFLRPKELAKDDSSSLSVVLHALEYLQREDNFTPDIIIFLQPTSPFRKAEHIDEGIEKIEDCDAVAGICEVKSHPYFMMKQISGDFIKPYLEIRDRPLRRQDVPRLFRLNTSLYIAKREYYDDVKETDPVAPTFKGKLRGVIMDSISSIDINDEMDFLLAEFIISSKFSLNNDYDSKRVQKN